MIKINKYYVFIALLSLALLEGCTTGPQRRVHAAAGVPRFVDISPREIGQDKPESFVMHGEAGAAYGPAWTDVGNGAGAEIGYAGVNARWSRFAFGWNPFYSNAQVSHEGTGDFGYSLWYSVNFGGGSDWRFSYQNTYTTANQVTQNTDCSTDLSGIFGTSCKAGSATARAQVRIDEVGFILEAEHRIADHESLILAPALYWTSINTSNQLDSDSSGNFNRGDVFWNPGFQAGFKARLGSRDRLALTLLAGAQWIKTFRPDRAVREVRPSFDVRFQF